jgi:hypothetical protein
MGWAKYATCIEKMLSWDVNTERNIMLWEVSHAHSIIIVQHMTHKASE